MKKSKIIFLSLIIMLLYGNSSLSMDFYPEMGADPFYSSLNPTYIDKSESDEENVSLITAIKNRHNQNKIKKELDKQAKAAKIAEEKDKKLEQKTIKESEKNLVTKKKRRPTVRELEAEQRQKERAELAKQNRTFKEKVYSFFKWDYKPKEIKHDDIPQNPGIDLSADYMEYYPERYEVEAVGNAKILFTKDNTKLIANKIIYNYDRNIIKANENVVLISNDSITEGDFIRIDLSKPDGLIENPITTTDDVKLTAKEANIYSDRIEEYDGVAKILKNEVLSFRADSFGNYVDQSGVLSQNQRNNRSVTTGIYSLKARTIYIDSKKDHDVITVKNADLLLRNHKIASIPSARIVSNKNNTVVESNIPELGSQSSLGMFAGPAIVLNVPGGSTLKLAPILTYGDNKLGFGGIARFRNQYNMTEIGYGTSKDQLLVRGRQKIIPGLTLNYSRMTNESEWFLGYRKPKYSAALNYVRDDYVKDLKLNFSQQYSAGVFIDDKEGVRTRDAEWRFRWMTQTYKPMFTFKNEEGNVGISTGLVAQTAASVYTSGDVLGLVRFGPALNTNVGPWRQSVIYYLTASAGDSPFDFDRYRYGHSNIVLIESLKICKYLSVGYLASLSMNRTNPEDNLFQENRFLVSVGPEYVKLTLGYDAYRHNTSMMLSMLVGSKDSEVAFKKTVIKNPDTLGKTNNKKKPKKKNYKRFLKEKITPSTVL